MNAFQRDRQPSALQRWWLGMIQMPQLKDAASVVQAGGVDGDVWYATDYAFPNHWPYGDDEAAPLPVVKRRGILREYMRAKVDPEVLLGFLILVGVYLLYLYMTASSAKAIPAQREWVRYADA